MRIIYALLLVLITATHGVAAPSITDVEVGGTIVITGSSFGAKTTAAPLRFEQFEEATAGGLPVVGNDVDDEITYWSGRDGAVNGYSYDSAISSDQQRHSNSARNAAARLERADGETAVSQYIWNSDIGWSDTGQVYLNAWFYIDFTPNPTYGSSGTSYYQIKLWTVESGPTSGGAVVTPYLSELVTMFNGLPDFAGVVNSYHRAVNTSSTSHMLYYDSGSISYTQRQWYNVILISEPGTNDDDELTTDGWRIAEISDGGSSYQVKSESGVNYLDDESLGIHPIDGFRFGYFAGNNLYSGVITVYWDDIYIDNTFSRVEIGDNETYANCTHRELQPATAWATDEITITPNYGSFSPGIDVYLFVVDSDNAASTGYGPITIPGASSTGATFSGVSVQ